MDVEERLKALEEEFQDTKAELQQILLDIRAVQMEAQTPLPTDTRKGMVSAQRDAAKEVEVNGDK